MKKGTEQEEQGAPLAAGLHAWYAENHRVLPWRGITDAYRIWISEIILQQTRVVQGFEYYNRFISRFPDVRSLAAADDDEVMKLWQGLGYYSRARNLLTAARQVVERFGGEFPTTYEGIRSLQGIGDYTAAAIASFEILGFVGERGVIFGVICMSFRLSRPMKNRGSMTCSVAVFGQSCFMTPDKWVFRLRCIVVSMCCRIVSFMPVFTWWRRSLLPI